MAAAIVVQMPVAPLSADSPVFVPAGCRVVTATDSFVTWTPVPAIGAFGARMSLPTGQMIAIFLPRCSIGPLAPDVAAACLAHVLNFRLNGAAWGRILTELDASGAFASAFNTLPAFHAHLFSINITIPANLHIVAADHSLGAAWALGVGAVAVRSRAIRFLSLATLDLLELGSGPLARVAPFVVVCQLVGAIGPVSTAAARNNEMSLIQAVGSLIHGAAGATVADAALARDLRKLLLDAILPRPFRAHVASWDELYDELRDGFDYLPSADRRIPVETKRIHYLAPGDSLSWTLQSPRPVLATLVWRAGLACFGSACGSSSHLLDHGVQWALWVLAAPIRAW